MSIQPWIPPNRAPEAPSAKDVNVETEVPAPPEVKEVVPPNKFQRIAPILMAVAVVGMIGIFLTSGIRKVTSPMMLMFPLMFLASAGGMLGGNGSSGGPRTAEINALRRKYLEMLSNLRAKVHNRATAQYDYLAYFAPPPETLAAMVGGPRTWERSRPGEDPTYFLAPRVGLARQRLGGGMRMADAAPEGSLEPIGRVFGERFYRAHRSVEDLPVVIDLKTHRSVQFFGDGDIEGLVRSMLLGLAVLHPPNLVLMAVVTERPEVWDWIKWLPHNQHSTRRDALGTERMVYTPEQAGAALASLLAERGDFTPDDKYTGNKPWLIVVADGAGRTIPGEGKEAVTVLRIGGPDEDGLEVIGARVEVNTDGTARKRRNSAEDNLRYWVSRLDTVGPLQARHIARRLARWRASTDKQIATARGTEHVQRSWASMHGIADVGTMGTSKWRPDMREGDPDAMRVPIGWDKDGGLMSLLIRDVAEQGNGSHGMVLGTTGSGKSSLLNNLLMGLNSRHTPEQLNVIYVDYKGEATFDGFDDLNATVEIISNLGSQDMIDRLDAVLRGEVEHRQRLRSTMGTATTGKKFKDARTYLKARQKGADIPPFPTLLVVVDEFTALLKDHPEFRETFEHLGRMGRSDRVQLLLATQSLTGVSLGQLLSNCGWKIAMKTASGQESAAVIETKDAYYLEKPGEGYLKVGGGDPKFFKAPDPEEPYFPPDEVTLARETVRDGAASSVAPFGVHAVPIPGVDTSADDDKPDEPVTVERTQQEIDEAPDTRSVVLDQLKGKGAPCRKLWLPPLLAPKPLGHLLERSALTSGDKAVLTFPIGLLDDPFHSAQHVFTVDLAGGNLVLVGRPGSGKSVALQSIALAASRLNSPKQLQIFGLDFGAGGKLMALEGLPHVGGVAARMDTDAVSRVIAEVNEVVTKRSELFREYKIQSMDSYRDRILDGTAPDDGMGDVLLLVDGFDQFKEGHEALVPAIADLVKNGKAVGVHVIVALQVFSTLGSKMNQAFNARIEFKLNEPSLTASGAKKLAEAVPAVPGRALDIATNMHIMIGAPRFDEVEAVDEAGLAAAISAVNNQWGDVAARQLRVLPPRVTASELALPEPWRGSKWTVPIGLYEKDLMTVPFDFMTGRHLTVFGNNDCGKTHLMVSMMQSLVDRFGPDEVKFIVVDLKGTTMIDAVDERYVLKWEGEQFKPNPEYDISTNPGVPKQVATKVSRSGLLRTPGELTAAMVEIANSLAGRAPTGSETKEQRRNRSWWSGPEIFLFVDDYVMVANAAPAAFAPLAPYWGNAPLLGIHSVLGCKAGMANRLLGQGGSLPKLNYDAGGSTLVMDALRNEGPIMGVRLDPRPPGRGLLITGSESEVIQTPVVPALEELSK